MFNKMKLMGTVAALAFGASAASAAIVFEGGEGPNAGTVLNGGIGQVQQRLTVSGASIDFQWDATSPNFLAYSTFTTGNKFSLTFDDYAPQSDPLGQPGQRSGFQLFAGSFATLGSLQISSADQCGSDVNAAFGTTECVLVTGAGNVPSPFVTPDETYGLFAAGTYTLMFSEGNLPDFGSAEFLVSEVPVPAAGFLLVGALGALGVARRKKKAA